MSACVFAGGWRLRHIAYPHGGREGGMGGGHLPDWYDSDGREYTDCDLQKGKGGGASVERELVCGLGEQGDAYE